MVRKLSGSLAALALVVGAATAAHAGPILTDGTWYDFAFLGAGSFATSGVGTSFGLAADTPPWTFTALSGGVTFTVTDAFFKGDNFNVFDFGTLVGTTPAVPQSRSGTTQDPNVALADSTYSHGSFFFGAGSHSITIQAVNSPSGNGSAYFRATPAAAIAAPEPGSLGLLALGALSAVGLMVRRRR